MTWRRAFSVGVALATVPFLAACSGDDSADPDLSGSPSPAPTVSSLPYISAPAEPSDAPSPNPGAGDELNDPDDGVGRDDPVTAPTPTGSADAARAQMMLTSWGIEDGVLDAAAVVEGVVVDDGTCELVLRSGDTTLSATGDAARSASSTDCARGLAVDVQGEGGTWELIVTFFSDGYEGATEPIEVELP